MCEAPADLIFPVPLPSAKYKERVVHCHSLHAGAARLSALQTLISLCLNVMSVHSHLTSEAPAD